MLRSVHVALSAGAGTIDPHTDVALAFNASAGAVTIPAGRAVLSDPFDFPLPPLTRLAITIAFGEVPAGLTGHPGSRTTSYLQAGDWSSAPSLSAPASTVHWYVLAGVDVIASAGAAVRDPTDPTRLLAAYDCGDHLHLSPAGYRALAEAIDLALFV